MGQDGLGDLQVDYVEQGRFVGLADGVNGFEVGQQDLAGFGPHASNVVQFRPERGLAASLPVMLQ